MIKIRLIVVLFFVTSLCLSQEYGFSVLENKADFVAKAKEISDKTKTIDSEFIQEKYLEVLEEKIISKGHFNFKKENSIRWEYLSPFEYLIIIKDGKIFIKDGDKESKFDLKSNKMFKNINEMIVKSVQGDIHEDENFNVNFYQSVDNYMVQLEPKEDSMREYLNKIHIYFSKTDYAVEKVKMVELSGDYTSIDFLNRKLNLPLGDEKFSFK